MRVSAPLLGGHEGSRSRQAQARKVPLEQPAKPRDALLCLLVPALALPLGNGHLLAVVQELHLRWRLAAEVLRISARSPKSPKGTLSQENISAFSADKR